MKDVVGSKMLLYVCNKLHDVEPDISVTFGLQKCTIVPNRTNNQFKDQYINNLGVI